MLIKQLSCAVVLCCLVVLTAILCPARVFSLYPENITVKRILEYEITTTKDGVLIEQKDDYLMGGKACRQAPNSSYSFFICIFHAQTLFLYPVFYKVTLTKHTSLAFNEFVLRDMFSFPTHKCQNVFLSNQFQAIHRTPQTV